jgi:MurNAc alpha-1-phosphate uridylyltransferase
MKAMILAAGRGERMRPLTDTCPKPMLKVLGIPLIEYHIRHLAEVGITDIVINHAWLGELIVDYLGDGSKWLVNITYSHETEGALETAGGIINALPLLMGNDNNEDEPFLIVNGDIFTNFDFTQLPVLAAEHSAHLCLIKNPKHNLSGDFQLKSGLLVNINNKDTLALSLSAQFETYTYSGIGLFRPSFFCHQQRSVNNEMEATINKVLALAPLIRHEADFNKISAQLLSCQWTDVGTVERLEQLNH